MPLFFIASGFTTNWNKNSFKDFFLRKSHSLLIPFLLYSTIVLMVQYAYLDVDVLYIFCNGWGGLALWFMCNIGFFSNVHNDIEPLFFIYFSF